MQVGIDTYVTVDEADRFIETYYPEFDDLAVVWGVLTEREKASYQIFLLWYIPESLLFLSYNRRKQSGLQSIS